MDRRESPRLAEPEPGPTDQGFDATRRPTPLGSRSAHRRPIPRRLVLGLIGAAGVAGLGLVVGGRFAGGLVANLHSSPARVASFREITLDPPPPPWIGVDAGSLLDRLRRRAGYGDRLRLLDEDLSALRRAFEAHFPWARRVVRVERSYPNRIVVRLEYREPVAYVRLRLEPPADRVVVDADGVVLPVEEIRPDAPGVAPPILIYPADGRALADARPGRVLTVVAGPSGRVATEPAEALAALAADLRRRGASIASEPASRRVAAIHRNKDGIWVELADGTMVLWGHTPGQEARGEPSAEEKWGRLRDRRPHAIANPRGYLRFTAGGIEARRTP